MSKEQSCKNYCKLIQATRKPKIALALSLFDI